MANKKTDKNDVTAKSKFEVHETEDEVITKNRRIPKAKNEKQGEPFERRTGKDRRNDDLMADIIENNPDMFIDRRNKDDRRCR